MARRGSYAAEPSEPVGLSDLGTNSVKVPGFVLLCMAFLHSAFFILPSPRGGFGAAWTENGRPQGICRKIRLHVNNQPTKTVNINLGLDGAAVVRRRAPPENKRETRATQEEHKRATPNFLASGWPALGLYLALGRFLHSAFCILHSSRGGFGWLCRLRRHSMLEVGCSMLDVRLSAFHVQGLQDPAAIRYA